MAKRGKKSGPPPADLFAAYMARGPERDPRILLPRSVLPLARGAFLFHGVVVQEWSAAWLAAFLFAEFFLVARLAVLGDRFSTGPQADPEHHRRTTLRGGIVWLVVAFAAALGAGHALDRSTRGAWFGLEDAGAGWAWPSWGIVAYLALLLFDFVAEGLAARRERRTFVPAGVLQASVFFVVALLLGFGSVFVAGFLGDLFGDRGVRAIFALVLVLARTVGELAVLWLPFWYPHFDADRKRRRGEREIKVSESGTRSGGGA